MRCPHLARHNSDAGHDKGREACRRRAFELERRRRAGIQLSVIRIQPGFGTVELGDHHIADAIAAYQVADVDTARVIALCQVSRVDDVEIVVDSGGQLLQDGEVLDFDHADQIRQQQHIADIVGEAGQFQRQCGGIWLAIIAAYEGRVGDRVAQTQHVEAADAQFAGQAGIDGARQGIGIDNRERGRPHFVIAEVVGEHTRCGESGSAGDRGIRRHGTERVGIQLEYVRIAVELSGIRVIHARHQRVQDARCTQ